MPQFTVTEPHPTVAQNAYTHSGRGGAGNFFRAPATTPASGVATAAPMALPPTTGRFYSGRGGAGNAHASVPRPVMSFEEQYKLQSHFEEKPVGHVGRGGAGNTFGRKASDASSRHSHSSTGSVKSGFFGRMSGVSLKSNNQ